jgi:hypothetical protein
MSQVTSIKQVFDLEAGTKLDAVSGILDSSYEQNSGNNRGGWTLQNVLLRDPDDRKCKIKVKFKNLDEVPKTATGRRLYIEAGHGKKGLEGVEIVMDEYPKGTFTKILIVKPPATFSFETSAADAGSGSLPGEGAPSASQSAPPASQPQKPPAPVRREEAARMQHQAWVEGVRKARHAAAQAASAYWIAILAGDFVASRYKDKFGEAMIAEQYRAMVSSIFIKLDKNGHVEELPYDISEFIQEKKNDPASK